MATKFWDAGHHSKATSVSIPSYWPNTEERSAIGIGDSFKSVGKNINLHRIIKPFLAFSL